MPNEDNKTLKYNHGEKSKRVPFIIYADLECLREKMHSCHNNSEKSYTEKKTNHTASGYSLFPNCLFDATKNNLNCYRGKEGERGKFRGAAHSICNLRYKTSKKIPVVFHNCSTYDYHIIIK